MGMQEMIIYNVIIVLLPLGPGIGIWHKGLRWFYVRGWEVYTTATGGHGYKC